MDLYLYFSPKDEIPICSTMKKKYLKIDPMDRTAPIFKVLAEQIARTKAVLERLEAIKRFGSYRMVKVKKTTIKRHVRKAHTRIIFSV